MKGFFVVVAGLLLMLSTGNARASSITLSTADLLRAEVVQTNTKASNEGDFEVVDFTPYSVLFMQTMSRPWSAGAEPEYVYSYIAADAALIGKNDVSGVDSFDLQIANINNSPWDLALFVQAADTTHLSEYRTVANNDNATFQHFAFDLSALGDDADDVQFLGFAVRSMLTGTPSNPDAFHVLVAPVPEPSTVMLMGLGCFVLAIYGKRRKNV